MIIVLVIIGSALDDSPREPVQAAPIQAPTLAPMSTPVPTRIPLYSQSPVTSRPFIELEDIATHATEYAPIDGDRKGYIEGLGGHLCSFVQVGTKASSPSYFYPTLKGSETIMLFDDHRCLNNTDHFDSPEMMDQIALIEAQYRINNKIATWYSLPNANFLTRPAELHPPNSLRERGWCIQSPKYPIQSFAVEYFWEESGIGAALHSVTLGSCKTNQ